MQYTVPEQSALLMESLSGGHAFYEDSFLFLSRDTIEKPLKDNWIMAIGYPNEGEFSIERFEKAIESVKSTLLSSTFLAIAPDFSQKRAKNIIDKDKYYDLSTSSPVPEKLKRHLKIAEKSLKIEVGREFTQAHRALWLEFLGRSPMSARVRSLYANIPNALQENKADLRLINAYDTHDNLVACMLMDFSLPHAVSYILGAHSRVYYIPHASDLIMEHTLALARKENKETIFLGLGVNEGIKKFKEKWNAKASQDYALAIWEEVQSSSLKESISEVLQSFMQPQLDGMTKLDYINSLPEQKPFAMLYEVEKNGKISYLAGTAHFFCYSFENYLKNLYQNIDTVLFEGPLDHESMEVVSHTGRNPLANTKRVIDAFSEEEIQSLERCIYGYTGAFSKILNSANKNVPNVREVLQDTRPWYAFFTLWTAWLELSKWSNSVDMEAYRLAIGMGKNVFGMEDLEEQITSLESAPYDRIVKFLKNHKNWNTYKKMNVKAYLGGDLHAMPGTSAEFPTVAERVIGPRDERFRQRMRPFIEQGRTAVFVGSAHLVNLRFMLQEDGFNVTKVLPSLSHKFWQKVKPDPEYHFPASTDPKPAIRSEHVRSPLSLDLLDNIYLQSSSTKSFFTAEALIPEQLEHYVKSITHSSALIINNFIAWRKAGLFLLSAFPSISHVEYEEYQAIAHSQPLQNSVDYSSEKHEILARQSIAKTIHKFMQSEASQLTVLSPFKPKKDDYASYFDKKVKFSQEATEAWYFMDLPFSPRQKLRNTLTRAAKELTISIEDFSKEHYDIVEEYVASRTLDQGTVHIFRQLESYIASSPSVFLYAARNKDNRLEAFLVADFSALSIAFYIFAFRRKDAIVGASDLVLNALVQEAQRRGYAKINLGLGINSGISFFKRKWNAYPLFPHVETTWTLV